MKHTLLILSLILSASAFATTTLNGAGASFPYPIYSKWFAEYQKTQKDVQFNYRPIGSGGGIRQLIAGTVDFGASDVPLKDKEKKKIKSKVLQIPTVIGAVTIVYNLPTLKGKKMVIDGTTLANIYLGKIKKWNDQAIAKLNPGVELPHTAIAPIRRADSSGTTAIFTQYLSSSSTDWENSVGAGKSVRWKTGFGGKGNDGVTGLVKSTPGAIGYIELAYAINNKLDYFAVKNPAGKAVRPTIANVSSSATSFMTMIKANPKAELVGSILNGRADNAYPIAAMTYLLVPVTDKNASTRTSLKAFVNWAMGEGQNLASELHYAPLPKALRAEIKTRVESL